MNHNQQIWEGRVGEEGGGVKSETREVLGTTHLCEVTCIYLM